jgi:hypothetical protein
MRKPELEARHRASAVVSKMMLICCRSLMTGYTGRRKNIGKVFPEIMVAMAIRVNDDRRRKPISNNRIARVTGLPRANVQRCLKPLIEHGMIEKSGLGYVGSDGYLEARLRARYFKRVIATIDIAARELQHLKIFFKVAHFERG